MEVFLALSTQWRVLVGWGVVSWQGIDYSVMPTVLRMKKIPRAAWPEVFEDLRVLERAALPELNRKH